MRKQELVNFLELHLYLELFLRKLKAERILNYYFFSEKLFIAKKNYNLNHNDSIREKT